MCWQHQEVYLPANDVLSFIGNAVPVIFWELKLPRQDFVSHVFSEGHVRILRVKWRVATQHDVQNHTQTPHVTALTGEDKYNKSTDVFTTVTAKNILYITKENKKVSSAPYHMCMVIQPAHLLLLACASGPLRPVK